jgi:hypothetical protein
MGGKPYMVNTPQRVAACGQSNGVDLIETGAAEKAQGRRQVGLRCRNAECTSTGGIDSTGFEGDLSATAVADTLKLLDKPKNKTKRFYN